MTRAATHTARRRTGCTLVLLETDPRRGARFEGLLETLPELAHVHTIADPGAGHLQALSLDPDVIVSDSAVGGISAADRLQELHRFGTRARWMVHAGGIDGDGVLDLVSQGIGGVLLRSDPPSLVLEGIRSVLRGGTPISPQLTPMLVQALRQARPEPKPIPESLLSPREHQLVRGLARGLRYQALASEFEVSIETVRTHLQRAYRKLQVRSRGEAIARYTASFGFAGAGIPHASSG